MLLGVRGLMYSDTSDVGSLSPIHYLFCFWGFIGSCSFVAASYREAESDKMWTPIYVLQLVIRLQNLQYPENKLHKL